MTQLTYKEVSPISQQEVELLLKTGDSEIVSDTLLRATYSLEDWNWLQSLCLKYINDNNKDVRRMAIQCFGHIARIHHKIDYQLIVPLLHEIGENTEYEGAVQDTLDDIEMFIDNSSSLSSR